MKAFKDGRSSSPGTHSCVRDPLFDVVKFLMMVWVVWGHLGLYGVVTDGAPQWLLNAKIGVNMPVFFVISGMLAASTFAKGAWAKVFLKVLRFMWPQFVFALLCGTLLFARSHQAASFVAGFESVMMYWFLRIIAVVYLVAFVVNRICPTVGWRWIGHGLCYLGMLFWPPCLKSELFDQVIHMYPYFVVGLMILRHHEVFRNPVWVVGTTLVFSFVVLFEGDSSANGMNFWRVSTDWRTVFGHVQDLVTFIARPFVGLIGTISLLGVVGFALSRFPALGRLAVLGTTSMGVYVIHEWPMSLLGQVSCCPLPSWTRWGVALAWFLVCHCVIMIINRSDVLSMLFYGRWRSKKI